MGFSIPQDVSVIGFEEDAILENLDTPLTAIRIPAYEMGVESVKMILKEIENDEDEPSVANSQNLTPVLVARRSTRALNV
jgi:DNA-binding LacI/PurR family transcriptional regulator